MDARISPQPNGLDLGDFVSLADKLTPTFSGCIVEPSSWHGSHVTGTIVANGYISGPPPFTQQIAGGAWGAKVVPVRVLGKCGV